MATFTDKTFITNKNLYSLRPKNDGLSLQAILAVLNSSLISRLYIDAVSQATKDDFPQVTITDVLALPFPTEFSLELQAQMRRLVEWLLWLNGQPSVLESTIENPRDPFIASYFEQWVDALVYELYFPSELRGAGVNIFSLTEKHCLPPLQDWKDKERLPQIRDRFEKLYDIKHPLRAAFYDLGSLELVRIIENKE